MTVNARTARMKFCIFVEKQMMIVNLTNVRQGISMPKLAMNTVVTKIVNKFGSQLLLKYNTDYNRIAEHRARNAMCVALSLLGV